MGVSCRVYDAEPRFDHAAICGGKKLHPTTEVPNAAIGRRGKSQLTTRLGVVVVRLPSLNGNAEKHSGHVRLVRKDGQPRRGTT
jgi:hypothetical protein